MNRRTFCSAIAAALGLGMAGVAVKSAAPIDCSGTALFIKSGGMWLRVPEVVSISGPPGWLQVPHDPDVFHAGAEDAQVLGRHLLERYL